jgi:hypothetical protein
VSAVRGSWQFTQSQQQHKQQQKFKAEKTDAVSASSSCKQGLQSRKPTLSTWQEQQQQITNNTASSSSSSRQQRWIHHHHQQQ